MGYGLRLSWPGMNARRSLSANPRGLPFSADQIALQRAWINTFSYDVQVHYKGESPNRIEEMSSMSYPTLPRLADSANSKVGLHSPPLLSGRMPHISRAYCVPHQPRAAADTLLSYCK